MIADLTPDPATVLVVRPWVESFIDYTLKETERGVIMHNAGTVHMPPSSPFQEGKLYSVINASGNGVVTVDTVNGESIKIGATAYDPFEMDATKISTDFTRLGSVWYAQ